MTSPPKIQKNSKKFKKIQKNSKKFKKIQKNSKFSPKNSKNSKKIQKIQKNSSSQKVRRILNQHQSLETRFPFYDITLRNMKFNVPFDLPQPTKLRNQKESNQCPRMVSIFYDVYIEISIKECPN